MYMTYIQCRSSKTQENQQKDMYTMVIDDCCHQIAKPPEHGELVSIYSVPSEYTQVLNSKSLSHIHFGRAICGAVRYRLLSRG